MSKKIIKSRAKTLLASTAGAVKKSAKPAASKGAAALPGRYDEPLASYSPYAQVRIMLEKHGVDDAGQKKAFEHATKALGLPDGQAKTYVREKLHAIRKDEEKKLGIRPTAPQREAIKAKTKEEIEADVDYRYPSKDAAMKHLLAVCRRNHLREQVLHIVKKDGKFAVVAAHVLPDGKPAAFKKGDTVHDCFIDDSRATVIEAGPEASTIRYDNERKYMGSKETTVSNFYLFVAKPLPAAAKKAEVKAPAKKAAAPAAKKSAKKAPAKKAAKRG